tara:strand:+ start:37 stop:621 length:585 start_codon:yes stop_codon:yes gene_type:complete
MRESELRRLIRETIKELNTHSKDIIGTGGSFNVYSFNKQSNKIIKYGKYPDMEEAKEHADMFKKHPDLFPKIYKENKNYIIVEKLKLLTPLLDNLVSEILGNINTPNNTQNKINKQPDKVKYIVSDLRKRNISDPNELKEWNSLIKSNPNLYIISNNIRNLFTNAKKIDSYLVSDFHSDNIGIDLEGNYKLLDF